jgi:hypothetical protein
MTASSIAFTITNFKKNLPSGYSGNSVFVKVNLTAVWGTDSDKRVGTCRTSRVVMRIKMGKHELGGIAFK